MLEALGDELLGFDDFRANGFLLPSTAAGSIETGLPLHRGPHPRYNEVVLARVGPIEAEWRRARFHDARSACLGALSSLRLLQAGLRRRLLGGVSGKPVILNRKDPIGTGYDFTELDAMAESIWNDTGSVSTSHV